MSEFPRRIQMQQWTAAERAIYDAVQLVEAMGADIRLTDAVILLGRARDRVADFVDGVEPGTCFTVRVASAVPNAPPIPRSPE